MEILTRLLLKSRQIVRLFTNACNNPIYVLCHMCGSDICMAVWVYCFDSAKIVVGKIVVYTVISFQNHLTHSRILYNIHTLTQTHQLHIVRDDEI